TTPRSSTSRASAGRRPPPGQLSMPPRLTSWSIAERVARRLVAARHRERAGRGRERFLTLRRDDASLGRASSLLAFHELVKDGGGGGRDCRTRERPGCSPPRPSWAAATRIRPGRPPSTPMAAGAPSRLLGDFSVSRDRYYVIGRGSRARACRSRVAPPRFE